VAKRTVKTLIEAAHDPVNGQVKAKTAKAQAAQLKDRKGLIYDLVALLTNTLPNAVSGITYQSKLDLVGNYLHELRTYAQSLKDAAATIREGYPAAAEEDEPLKALEDLSDILIEGAGRSEQYLAASRQFAPDLNNIRTEIHNQLTHLHAEI